MSEELPTLLSMNQVVRLTTLSRTMVNKYRVAGDFPRAVPIGEKRIAFVASEIHEWILERMSRRTAA
ncbi:AlpA family phage regulatory protein [Devosia sp. A8/3-2]|nr:AlpA family phage regulatory protein [Devosia sp. A8/3-2]